MGIILNIENWILENSPLLKTCLGMALRSALKDTDGILFVNIEFIEKDIPVKGRYPGMEHVVRLRVEHQEQVPVLFYGFESSKVLAKRPESSVLKSPAVSYIQLPSKIGDISKSVLGLTKARGKGGLDPGTRRIEALDKIGIFRHDLQNALNSIEIVNRLKRASSQETLGLIWEKTRNLLMDSPDLIQKNRIRFQEIKKYFSEVLTEKQIAVIDRKLVHLDKEYKSLLNVLLSSYSQKDVLLNRVQTISSSLRQVLEDLKEKTEE